MTHLPRKLHRRRDELHVKHGGGVPLFPRRRAPRRLQIPMMTSRTLLVWKPRWRNRRALKETTTESALTPAKTGAVFCDEKANRRPRTPRPHLPLRAKRRSLPPRRTTEAAVDLCSSPFKPVAVASRSLPRWLEMRLPGGELLKLQKAQQTLTIAILRLQTSPRVVNRAAGNRVTY